MHYRANQYTVLQVVVVLAVIAIAIDSLIESTILQNWAARGSNKYHSAPSFHNSIGQNSTNTTAPTPGDKRAAHHCRLPIDHRNSQTGFFNNRYWVNDEFYLPGGPIFIQDVGESGAESSAMRYLFSEGSHLQQLLREFHGIGIVWEHRYYGDSFPFLINTESSFEQLHSLSFEQALADIPYFAQRFALPGHSEIDLTPARTPWIILGCSYSGLRAAASRLLYPKTFFAAYAASAPIQLEIELTTFFEAVYMKMMDQGYASCAMDLHSIMLYLDRLLSSPESAISVKRFLLGPGAEYNSNGDFAVAIANIFSYFQGRGIKGGAHSLASLCDHLEGDRTPASEYLEVDELFRSFASWPGLWQIVNAHFNTSCGIDGTAATCDLAQINTEAGSISWTWQLCSELGLFVTQNSGPSSLVSRFMSLDWRASLCKRQFPHIYAEKHLADLPPVDRINQLTGGVAMRPSNTFFTAGEYDPWRGMTPLLRKNATKETLFSITQEIPEYNTSTDANAVFGYLLKDAQHCYDWSLQNPEARNALVLFSQALKTWLPLYRSMSSG